MIETVSNKHLIITRRRIWWYNFMTLVVCLLPIFIGIPFYHCFPHFAVEMYIVVWALISLLRFIILLFSTRYGSYVLIDLHTNGIQLHTWGKRWSNKLNYDRKDIDGYCVTRWWLTKEQSKSPYADLADTFLILYLSNGHRRYYNLTNAVPYAFSTESHLIQALLIAAIHKFSNGTIKWHPIPDSRDKDYITEKC